MEVKSSNSVVKRFRKKNTNKRLLELVCDQPIVSGDKNIAKQVVKFGKLREITKNCLLISQGDVESDIFFIICGKFDIIINSRVISTRTSGNHVGEMAMLDITAKRSATVRAAEDSVVLQLSERNFSRIANRYPDLWRRLSIEISNRLRERSKFIKITNAVPIVFIGSSSEALIEAKSIVRSLCRRKLQCKLWSQGVFQLSKTAIEDLIRIAKEIDYAVLLLTPDDMVISRGKKRISPRDNIIFELGLFMGSLGRERTFIVVPKSVDVKLPTDLLGITNLQYPTGKKSTIGKRFKALSKAISQRIVELGSI